MQFHVSHISIVQNAIKARVNNQQLRGCKKIKSPKRNKPRGLKQQKSCKKTSFGFTPTFDIEPNQNDFSLLFLVAIRI